jgi:AraC-like DNA-binding protein
VDYSELPPSPALSHLIKTYWFLESGNDFTKPGPQRIFPDGCMELIIHFGDAFLKQKSGITAQQSSAFVFGQLESHLELIPSSRMGVMGVKFHPQGFSSFTKLPLITIKNQEVSLNDLFGRNACDIHDKIAEAKNALQRVKIMEASLMKEMRRTKISNGVTAFIVNDIHQSRGLLSVGSLVKKYHISEKKLERLFNQQVGLSPKSFSRIVRFQQVFRLVSSSTNLTELALNAGYFDQAHFIREFRSFTGLSPRQYFSRDNGFTQLFLDD